MICTRGALSTVPCSLGLTVIGTKFFQTYIVRADNGAAEGEREPGEDVRQEPDGPGQGDQVTQSPLPRREYIWRIIEPP